MDEVKVYIEVEVNPTESEEKVKSAVAIFGNIQTRIQSTSKGAILTAEAEGLDSLTKLYNILHRERICDAARGVLFEGLNRNAITFFLNKQVAYAEHISFSNEVAESPLGPIKVKIECENCDN